MDKKTVTLFAVAFLAILTVAAVYSSGYSTSLIIDHNCTDLWLIPMEWIDSVQAKGRLHYAHTSHGEQLTTGLARIENADTTYNIARGVSYLPNESGALCIFDGQENDSYITPDKYWETTEGMNMTRNVLHHNTTINASMWAWCCQMDYYSETEVQAYLDSITVLETEYPNVTFIYMTGNAQGTGADGYNRYLRDEQVRQYCRDHNKVLFDFADLDSWWFNPTTEEWEHATYEYEGNTVPVEHPHFHGDEAGHTTYESCEQKGKALWWMMARLEGWSADMPVAEDNYEYTAPRIFFLSQNYPNPCVSATAIKFALPKESQVTLTIYDMSGRLVKTLVNKKLETGYYTVDWDSKNLSQGIYFYKIQAHADLETHTGLETGDYTETRKMILLK